MKIAVCSFSGSGYDPGLGALINSLYIQGYCGDIFIGYSSALPNWTAAYSRNRVPDKEGGFEIIICEGLRLCFLRLPADIHPANYKPEFMLRLFHRLEDRLDFLYFFDPDIVLNTKWLDFEHWAQYGYITLCEDVNSPLPISYPRRLAWQELCEERGMSLQFKKTYYANGGFIGVPKAACSFLGQWQTAQLIMSDYIGGMDKSVADIKNNENNIGYFAPFKSTDQDALNIAIGLYDKTVSWAGRDAMGFVPGRNLMFHTIGKEKPWRVNLLGQFLQGRGIREADKAFWKYTYMPIPLFSRKKIRIKRIGLQLFSFLSRFYHK